MLVMSAENADKLREVLQWTHQQKEKWWDGSITGAPEQRRNESTVLEERMTTDASDAEDVCTASHSGTVSQDTPFTPCSTHYFFFRFPKGKMEATIITNFSVLCVVLWLK